MDTEPDHFRVKSFVSLIPLRCPDGRTVAGAVVAHAVQAVEVDIGVVAAEAVLAARHAVDEDLELVEVRLEVAREDEEQEAVLDLRVRADELAAEGDIDGALRRVAEAGLRVLDDDGLAVGGVSGAIEDDALGVGGGGDAERRDQREGGTHLSGLSF